MTKIHPLIENRYSPRAYADTPIDPDTLTSLFEAARWGPSAMNAQPWRFIVATRENPAEYRKLLSCLRPGNQNWARTAPVLAITCTHSGPPESDDFNAMKYFDAGLAVTQLAVEALSHGLYVRHMGGIQRDKIREVYHIPEDFSVVAGMTIGRPGDLAVLDEDLQTMAQAPRKRRPLDETVFSGRWAIPADFTAPERS